ncbi:MAG: hypothetical protein WBK00_05755, partial [Limnochordia bacterium]
RQDYHLLVFSTAFIVPKNKNIMAKRFRHDTLIDHFLTCFVPAETSAPPVSELDVDYLRV